MFPSQIEPPRGIVFDKTPASQAMLRPVEKSALKLKAGGIHDYIDDKYLPFTKDNPKHRWTREEQIALRIAQTVNAALTHGLNI